MSELQPGDYVWYLMDNGLRVSARVVGRCRVVDVQTREDLHFVFTPGAAARSPKGSPPEAAAARHSVPAGTRMVMNMHPAQAEELSRLGRVPARVLCPPGAVPERAWVDCEVVDSGSLYQVHESYDADGSSVLGRQLAVAGSLRLEKRPGPEERQGPLPAAPVRQTTPSRCHPG